ncbi:MAG: DsbC family protein [Rubrivivax sp.]|uniref:DsbC family protein n=1 Tax=Ottowia sp. TaxID=1898956 RepID=UPI0011D38557|nr:DsbC family protein [Ottowia sp.]MCC6812471.1 DsbC family protein [Rubrivivax sp.]MCZ2090668.1 DsbC family protein [Burkholderiales bacterium]TXI17348.1 MAG: DsbC family protein [Ottowia sp.]HNJ46246.1 DsbC family protein [Ottowia sp.]HNK53991.1 DsbC family protein [Ottowia sp.]
MTPVALLRPALAALCLTLPLLAAAQESTIRKNLAERIPALSQIDEISKTPMPGLFEVRVGTDVLYTDAEGNFLLHGSLLDARNGRNLTEERVNKLLAVDFKTLELKNAITMVRGNGKRKLAVFEDPNCGYCKRFEKDLQKVDNVTVHLFLIPILGEDSVNKSRQIWCAADRAKSWNDWMLRDVAPKGKAICNTEALTANLEFANKHRITGTPTLIFEDGSRVPGAIGAVQLEERLARR